MEYSIQVERRLLELHQELKTERYQHGGYQAFVVADPKPREIHKASVRDRVLHHAIHRVLAPYYDKRFLSESYSNRLEKGVHKAVKRFSLCAWKMSRNRTRTVWVLQCDVRKFFASIDHDILLERLWDELRDPPLQRLLKCIVLSFSSRPGKGIPLGNLTSQLFSNIYLHPLDTYVKRVLRIPLYLRYADDILIASTSQSQLWEWYATLSQFLEDELRLVFHEHKTSLRAWHQGIDFLGYVSFLRHRVVRTRTKKRIKKRIGERNQSSYLGILSHANEKRLARELHLLVQAKQAAAKKNKSVHDILES